MDRRVLIIEDDPDISRLVELHLADIGCSVAIEADGRSGLRRATEDSFDLIVLDLMLPEVDGLEICRRVRERPSYTPILMLTAKSSEMDRVLGLELGADDYLTKPFSVLELVARVKAILRRVVALRAAEHEESDSLLQLGSLEMDPVRRQVSVNDKRIELTAKEFDLLSHFARRPGRVYSRAELLESVWGYGHRGYEHTVNSHINRLRAKIEPDPAHPMYILTVWGVGYKMRDPSEA